MSGRTGGSSATQEADTVSTVELIESSASSPPELNAANNNEPARPHSISRQHPHGSWKQPTTTLSHQNQPNHCPSPAPNSWPNLALRSVPHTRYPCTTPHPICVMHSSKIRAPTIRNPCTPLQNQVTSTSIVAAIVSVARRRDELCLTRRSHAVHSDKSITVANCR